MLTYVPNVNPNRWDTIKPHLEAFGLAPVRWPGETTSPKMCWTGRPDRIPHRQAILATYRNLFRHLLTVDVDVVQVFQDDIRLTTAPTTAVGGIHLYGGYQLRYQDGTPVLVDPTRYPHVCPKGFAIHHTLIPAMWRLLEDATTEVCTAWVPLLSTATYDTPPIIYDYETH